MSDSPTEHLAKARSLCDETALHHLRVEKGDRGPCERCAEIAQAITEAVEGVETELQNAPSWDRFNALEAQLQEVTAERDKWRRQANVELRHADEMEERADAAEQEVAQLQRIAAVRQTELEYERAEVARLKGALEEIVEDFDCHCDLDVGNPEQYADMQTNCEKCIAQAALSDQGEGA